MEILSNILNPEDTSTGGGSASALAGAMAAALVAMVSRLSTPQEEEQKLFYTRLSSQSERLSQQLIQGSQGDARAFQSVRNAYQLPRQEAEEKAVRDLAIQSAWIEAALVPLQNAERCMQVFALGVELSGRANPKTFSDLQCALLLARAGLLGCLENVEINLPAIKDITTASKLASQASELNKRMATLEPVAMPARPPNDAHQE
jgi:formiminotetrahydrofolate cyclodeaminase